MDRTQGLAVHLPEEGRILLVVGRGGDIVHVCGGVELLHVREYLVPQVAAAAKGLLHQLRLFRRGVEAKLKGGVLEYLTGLHLLFLRPAHEIHPVFCLSNALSAASG